CSAIEPGPPFSFWDGAHGPMLAGPWQPRSLMCAFSTAGVASVISAVLTLPVLRPELCASSRIVVRWVTAVPVPATLEIRPLLVFTPVAQAVPEAAESVT